MNDIGVGILGIFAIITAVFAFLLSSASHGTGCGPAAEQGSEQADQPAGHLLKRSALNRSVRNLPLPTTGTRGQAVHLRR
jgi:hypothetical protein